MDSLHLHWVKDKEFGDEVLRIGRDFVEGGVKLPVTVHSLDEGISNSVVMERRHTTQPGKWWILILNDISQTQKIDYLFVQIPV